MSFEATSDLLESPIRFFEVEDSIGSKHLVRRQLTVADDSDTSLANMREGYWVVPHPTLLHEYISASLAAGPGAAAPWSGIFPKTLPAYPVASLSGSQGDVTESGGVTGLHGDHIGRTKIYEVGDAASLVPGAQLTLGEVDIGDGSPSTHPGLKLASAGELCVAVVEFFDSANGVLQYKRVDSREAV
jgi:hypothetical protein